MNGHHNNDVSDSSSKAGAPSGWINSLAGGGGVVAGAAGQSTLSRKSGKDIVWGFPDFVLNRILIIE
ncbi:unnamed protein product, partial [Rotaria magnacalcarata]